jgi:hypothetical protein
MCASCHSAELATQRSTPMAKALERVPQCRILHQHPTLTVRLGRYSYRIVTRGSRSIYTVTDGSSSFSEPIAWAFGQGQAGQTYVYWRNGSYYESRVSFFNDTQKLDLTLGYTGTHPRSVEEAAGRRISTDEARDCFACHSTASVSDGHLHLETLMPGITCEGCHGPGAAHVAAMKAGEPKPSHIFNPGSLDTEDLSDFCGSCHRSWEQVEMMHLEGIRDVRFQPYRLAMSKCFDPSDPRISCLACHNPHQQLRTDAAFYNSRCLTCHMTRRAATQQDQPSGKTPYPNSSPPLPSPRGPRGEGRRKRGERVRSGTAPACPVARKNCITCHMPKYELPGAHYKFTDHYIRVVRRGQPYPD